MTNLDTVRDTLAGIHADLKLMPGFELASELIETALVEIAVVERRLLSPSYQTLDAPAHLRRQT